MSVCRDPMRFSKLEIKKATADNGTILCEFI